MLWPRIEHQYRADASVVGENWEHSALVTLTEVKEAILGEDAIEAPTERQLPHVGNNPFMMRQALTAERYHGRR